MRTLRRNRQKMLYSLQIGEVPVYVRDDDNNIIYQSYTDTEGNEIFYLDENGNKIPMDTGETQIIYGTPQEFDANIATSGGEAEAQTFGLSLGDYEAVALYVKGAYPLVEGCLVWKDSKPKCEYENEVAFEIENEDGDKVTVYSTVPEETSADYRILKISPSLNFTKAILKAVVK